MFSTNKNRKIGMLIFLFVVSFIVGMLINIQRLGSLPMKLIQVEWNDTVGVLQIKVNRFCRKSPKKYSADSRVKMRTANRTPSKIGGSQMTK